MVLGMGRPELHSAAAILDGARTAVLADGAATINEIAAMSGAPAGSIYHRFGSRDVLLAEMWIRAVVRSQDRFLVAIESADEPMNAAVAAGLSVLDFAIQEGDDARLLISLRRTQLIRSPLPPQLGERLRQLNRPVESAVARLARDIYGTSSMACRQRVALAIIDIPYGAIRRFLIADTRPPDTLRPHVERAIRAVLDSQPPRRRRRT
jgi:AcrR family transcriptional regulator